MIKIIAANLIDKKFWNSWMRCLPLLTPQLLQSNSSMISLQSLTSIRMVNLIRKKWLSLSRNISRTLQRRSISHNKKLMKLKDWRLLRIKERLKRRSKSNRSCSRNKRPLPNWRKKRLIFLKNWKMKKLRGKRKSLRTKNGEMRWKNRGLNSKNKKLLSN